MDVEQQIRLNFLEQVQADFDRIETILLGLASSGIEPKSLDAALRSAHSIKGGAAMMGFTSLSDIAHRLEDYLKILRARPGSIQIDRELETLLLQGVDCLRTLGDRHRSGSETEAGWLEQNADPIFSRLRDRLGALTEADEDRLLAEEEQEVDVATFMFARGVGDCLEQLQAQRPTLSPPQLRQELADTAEQLADFGRVKGVEAFISLCDSIRQQLDAIAPFQLETFADRALAAWEQAYALIQLDRLDRLSDHLDVSDLLALEESEFPDFDPSALDAIAELQGVAALFGEEDFDPAADIEELVPSSQFSEFVEDSELEEFDPAAFFVELQDAATAIAEPEPELEEFDPAAFFVELQDAATAIAEPEPEPASVTPAPSPSAGSSVRISVEQLRQINALFGRLILERNAVNLRLNQITNFLSLLRERTQRLDASNEQLRQWYDLASQVTATGPAIAPTAAPAEQLAPARVLAALRNQFDDPLEMDRYGDLNLLFQEQMETIVQLLEVASDIDLSVREMSQGLGELNFTSRDLQRQITQAQMRPFSEAIGHFPRVVRDLCWQYGKSVELKLEGETTLVDRFVLDLLGDPLNHLLRNAFDHGIEPPQVRLAAGKPECGTISLRASNQGNQTLVAIADDGGGIDTDRIRDRLLRSGFPSEALDRLSESDLLETIFEPGFSTADRVSELSGRGVGLDVVRANLQQIRGEIRIETERGRGTTFTIAVPQALSILRASILESAGMLFAVPVDTVAEFVRLEDGQSDRLWWQGRELPLVRLEEWLQFQRPRKPTVVEGTPMLDRAIALIVGREERWQGIYIERYWSEQEVAIRPVDSLTSLPPGFRGATLLGNGRVVPLIDPVELVEWIARERDGAQPRAIAFQGEERTGTPAAGGELVLAIDDSIHVRRYLALSLEKAGYQVEQAKDGQEAVDKLLGGLRVKAAICDIEMPRLDGYGVLAEIKSRPEFRSLPIIMLTSRSSEKHRKLAMQLGAAAYFSKPYNEQELLKTLEQFADRC